MRIAQIASLVERVPPKKYGGIERVVHALTEELVARGHEVTLFASGDSKTSATLNSTTKRALRGTNVVPLYGNNLPYLHLLGRAFAMHEQFDVIHHHVGYAALPLAELVRTPTIMTIHNPVLKEHLPIYEEFKKTYIVSISADQGRDIAHLNYAGVVHNGLPFDHYPFSAKHDGYLLYVGRICEEKGTREAVEVARRLDLPLILAAKLDDTVPEAQEYFAKYVKPHLGKKIRWVGEVSETKRNKLMSRAMAFLHPGTWREPFGLTLIEAMACGTPVVAFNNGSIPEIVVDGQTGFVVQTVSQMARAVKHIQEIDRTYTKDYARKNFSARRMANEYEELYRAIARKKHALPIPYSTVEWRA
jgi:glycosyltransferase involved in cell wall biosynthesis